MYDESVERGLRLSKLIDDAVKSDDPELAAVDVGGSDRPALRRRPRTRRRHPAAGQAGRNYLQRCSGPEQDPAWSSQGRTYRDARSARERPAADLLWGSHQVRARCLLDADKTYEAVVMLGAATTTGDAEGEVVFTGDVSGVESRLEPILQQFLGEQSQMPPMYSALKHKGRPLYAYARAGEVVERAARDDHGSRARAQAFDATDAATPRPRQQGHLCAHTGPRHRRPPGVRRASEGAATDRRRDADA